jgi:hypothetical protein
MAGEGPLSTIFSRPALQGADGRDFARHDDGRLAALANRFGYFAADP